MKGILVAVAILLMAGSAHAACPSGSTCVPLLSGSYNYTGNNTSTGWNVATPQSSACPSGAGTLTLGTTNNLTCTLSGTVTLAAPNPFTAGGPGLLTVIENGTGGYNVVLNQSGFCYPSGASFVGTGSNAGVLGITTTAGAVSDIKYHSDTLGSTNCIAIDAVNPSIVSFTGPVITGVTVGGTTSPTYQSGIGLNASIGMIGVSENNGAFNGTVALGSGVPNTYFGLSATSLPANLIATSSTPTCSTTTPYTITITPTQAGATNSGTAYPITVSCTAAGATPSVTAQSTYAQTTGNGGAPSTNNSNAPVTLVTGDWLVVPMYECASSSCSSAGSNPALSGITGTGGTVLGTCTQITGVNIASPGGNLAGLTAYRCPITTGASAPTLTVTWTSTCYDCTFFAMDVHNINATNPDAGIGNTTPLTNSANMSVSTSAGTNGNNNIVFAAYQATNAPITITGGGIGLLPTSPIGWAIAYLITNSSSVVQSTATQNSAGNYLADTFALTP